MVLVVTRVVVVVVVVILVVFDSVVFVLTDVVAVVADNVCGGGSNMGTNVFPSSRKGYTGIPGIGITNSPFKQVMSHSDGYYYSVDLMEGSIAKFLI